MGLLGTVTKEDVSAALAGPPKWDTTLEYPFYVKEVSEPIDGPKGTYHFLKLGVENPQTGKAIEVRHVLSFSPGARNMVIGFCTGVGLDPNDLEDVSQLQGLQGTCKLKYKPSQNDPSKEYVEIARILQPAS